MHTMAYKAILLFVLAVSAMTGMSTTAGVTFNDSVVHLVSSVLVEPFLMKREEGWVGSEPQYEGFVPDLLREASEHTGLNFRIRLSSDGRVGDRQANGHWDGMIGDLLRADVDVAVGPLTITSQRIRVIDFSKPFMSTGLVVAASTRSPPGSPLTAGSGGGGRGSSSLAFILQPFTLTAWLLIAVAFVALAVCALIIRRVSPYRSDMATNSSSGMHLTTHCVKEGRWSACTLKVTAILFSFLTLVLYTAGLVSLLVYNADSRLEQNKMAALYGDDDSDLVDMVQSGLYKIGVVRDGSANAFLRHSSIPIYDTVYKSLHYVDNITTGLELVRKDPSYIFIMDEPLLDYYLQKPPCDTLRKVGPPLTSNGFGLGFRMKSPLYGIFNLIILQLREEGVLQRLERKWWHERAQCRHKAPTGVRKETPLPPAPSVDGAVVGGSLFVLALGLLVALLASIVERLREARTKKGSVVSGCLNDSAGNLFSSQSGVEGRDLALT